MKKIFTSIVFMLVVVAFNTTAFAGILKFPYLIYPGQNTAMEVLWQDDTAGETTNTISWGTDTNYRHGSATVPEYGDRQHKFTITGLKPDTKYYYKVADATNGVYGTGSFITAPTDNATHVKFLAMGDSRGNPVGVDALMQEMRNVYLADPEYQRLTIHNGDWVSTDGESYWTTQWFVPTMKDIVTYVANSPIDGCKGNHDNTSGFSATFPKYFPFPYVNQQPCSTDPASPDYMSKQTGGVYLCGNTPGMNYVHNLYWSFDYGPVHFTVLDEYSSYAPGSAQYTWLVNDLATTTKPWKILMYHEPAYSAGQDGDNTTVRALEPLVTKYGVDLIYSGHSHNYARTEAYNSLQANGDPIALNVPHITNGGGGTQTYTVDLTNKGSFPHVITAWQAVEFMTFDVTDKTLTMTAYQVNNTATAVNTSWPWAGSGKSTVTTVPGTNGCLAGMSVNGNVCPATTRSMIERVVLHHYTDVSSQLSVKTTKMVYNPAEKLYKCNLVITNNGPALTGNIDVVLDGILNLRGIGKPIYDVDNVTSSQPLTIPTTMIAQNTGLITDVTLVNATGSNNGEPMIRAKHDGLGRRESIVVPLSFSNPNGTNIIFTPVVYHHHNDRYDDRGDRDDDHSERHEQ